MQVTMVALFACLLVGRYQSPVLVVDMSQNSSQYRTLRAGREFSIAVCRYWGARYFSWKFLQCTLLQLEVTSMVILTWWYGETWLRLLTLSFGHQRVFFGRPTPTTMYTVDILDPQRRLAFRGLVPPTYLLLSRPSLHWLVDSTHLDSIGRYL